MDDYSNSKEARTQKLFDSQFVQTLRTKKIGLVLAGGGAKGAHQAGALKVLHDLKIEDFHVVSGVSSGGLNACGIAKSKTDELYDLWNEMSFRTVIKISWRAPLILICTAVSYYFRYVPNVVTCCLLTIGFYLLFGRGAFVFGILATGFCLFPPLGPVLGYFTRGVGKNLGRFAARISSVSLQDNIRNHISSILGKDEDITTICDTYLTLATVKTWFDPDFPKFAPLSHGERDVRVPNPNQGGILPDYFNIRHRKKHDAEAIILQSAALPFVFPEFSINGIWYQDGGIIENPPINVALGKGCDLILILDLSDNGENTEIVFNQLPRLRRAMALERRGLSRNRKLYLDWLDSTDEAEHKGPVFFPGSRIPMTGDFVICPITELEVSEEVYRFYPSKPLGGLLFGTLDFRRSKARSRLELGELDMLDFLEKKMLEETGRR